MSRPGELCAGFGWLIIHLGGLPVPPLWPLLGDLWSCGVEYSVSGGDGRDRDGMVAELEFVGNAFAPCVCHDDSNASVVVCCVG